MSTPAGARRARLAVELSRLSEWPAGDLTAFVARESLVRREVRGGEGRDSLSYLTVSPAGPVSLTLSDPITVWPELSENKTRSVSSLSSKRPPRTFRPELSRDKC